MRPKRNKKPGYPFVVTIHNWESGRRQVIVRLYHIPAPTIEEARRKFEELRYRDYWDDVERKIRAGGEG